MYSLKRFYVGHYVSFTIAFKQAHLYSFWCDIRVNKWKSGTHPNEQRVAIELNNLKSSFDILVLYRHIVMLRWFNPSIICDTLRTNHAPLTKAYQFNICSIMRIIEYMQSYLHTHMYIYRSYTPFVHNPIKWYLNNIFK